MTHRADSARPGLLGALGDRFGRKRILQLAALVFAISAVGSALPKGKTLEEIERSWTARPR